MTVPPALTWTCLFPSDASYLCDGGPTWFLAMLPAWEGEAPAEPCPVQAASRLGRSLALPNQEQPRRVRISFGPHLTPRSGENLDGQVMINPDPRCETQLHAAGFQYIRRFAVLPSLKSARWFIPLDSAPVAAGAFDLYTPARTSARLKQLAAKALARTRLPLWYRDHILIGSRQVPPIEHTIRTIFHNTDVRLALSAGAPEPARNRKPSLAVLNPAGQIIALAKLGNSGLSRQITNHEATTLSGFTGQPALTGRVPRLLFAGDVDGQFLMIQSALDGKPAPAELTPAHYDFLAALRRGPAKWATESAMIRSLEERLALLPPQLGLASILDNLRPTLQSLRVPSTIVHGDFAPWNLRQHNRKLSAFDWEYAQFDGLPLIDETHFRLQVGYLLEKWTDAAAARELHAAAVEAAPMIVMVQQASALQAVYLLDMLARLLEEGYDPADDMLVWYRRVLHRLVPSRKELALA